MVWPALLIFFKNISRSYLTFTLSKHPIWLRKSDERPDEATHRGWCLRHKCVQKRREERRSGSLETQPHHAGSLLFHKHSWRGLPIVQPRLTKSPWDSPPPACLTHPEVIPWKAGSHSCCTLLLIWPPAAWRLPTVIRLVKMKWKKGDWQFENSALRSSSTTLWRRTTRTPWGMAPRSPTSRRTRIHESFHVSCTNLVHFPNLSADDFNRVVLEPEEGVPDSDYINASYVDVSQQFLSFRVQYFPFSWALI